MNYCSTRINNKNFDLIILGFFKQKKVKFQYDVVGRFILWCLNSLIL